MLTTGEATTYYLSSPIDFCVHPAGLEAPDSAPLKPPRASPISTVSVARWGSFLAEEFLKGPGACPGMAGPAAHVQRRLSSLAYSKQWRHY